MKLRLSILLTLACLVNISVAQIVAPVKWNITQTPENDTIILLQYKAEIDPGWHMYGTALPEGGPQPTTITYTVMDGAEPIGALEADRQATETYEPLFEQLLTWYSEEVTFTQRVQITRPDYKIEGHVRYMGCNDMTCLPPTTEEFLFTPQETETEAVGSVPATRYNENGIPATWSPVTTAIQQLDNSVTTAGRPLWYIFIAGLIGGLIALLTPCVWPMIPLTVSYFIKQEGGRRRAVRKALLFGISIIVIYLALGLIVTTLFEASTLNDLSTNAYFNIFFFLLLVLFAISFFGAFNLEFPASWTTRIDAKADAATGIFGIFLMAFTLALVSFSCTGPIIGTLLVEAATAGITAGPAVGMFAFALALAAPFTLFAIFPSAIRSLPKSGAWMNNVKVVLAFLELAFALKFLSVADLAYGWGILPRETFITLWVLIFALMGLYLLGAIRFKHDAPVQYLSVTRLFLAIIPLAFALYLVPGLWGAPLKSVSAFLPPVSTQDFNLHEIEAEAVFDDYDQALTYAKQHGKPLFIDFSGYGCVNCRKMEAAVFTDTKVKEILDKDYVFVKLMVDDKRPLPEPMKIEENGITKTLRTIGDKWSFLQRHKFGANAQPYYLLLSPTGEPLAAPYGYDENIDAFVGFLESGIK